MQQQRQSATYTTFFCFCAIVAVWLLAQWFYARPSVAAADWMGWRQADTQAIALNFRDSGNDILHPQIDWRGEGPGFVETEFQLYPWLIKLLLPASGNIEWPGQLLSMLAIAGAIALAYRTLATVYSPAIALLAALAALANLGSLHLATSIQPDALCFFFYCAQLVGFYWYLQAPARAGSAWLAIATLCAILAVLIKPTALHLGIIQFVALLLGARHKLKSPLPWICWVLILALFGIYVRVAHLLYEQYGNTFGIGFGGDAKWPGLAELLNPMNYYTLLRASLTWGIGITGLIGGLILLVRRRLTAWEWALIAGNAAHLVVSMRYSASIWLASHYHIFAVFLGAWLTAHALHEIAPALRQWRNAVLIAIGIALVAQAGLNTYHRVHHPDRDGERFIALAQMAQPFLQPNELVVVRSPTTARVDGWAGGENNFEDPRLFYLTATKGWVLARDEDNVEQLQKSIAHGARHYIHLEAFDRLEKTQAWLEQNAQVLASNEYGAIYRFNEKPVNSSGE